MQPIQAAVSQLNTSTSKEVTKAAVGVAGPITNTIGCLQPKPYCSPQISTVQSTYSTNKNDLPRNQAESNKLNEERNNDDKSESSKVENKITNEYEANNINDDMERTGRTLNEEISKEKKDNTEVKLDHTKSQR